MSRSHWWHSLVGLALLALSMPGVSPCALRRAFAASVARPAEMESMVAVRTWLQPASRRPLTHTGSCRDNLTDTWRRQAAQTLLHTRARAQTLGFCPDLLSNHDISGNSAAALLAGQWRWMPPLGVLKKPGTVPFSSPLLSLSVAPRYGRAPPVSL